MFEKRRQPKKIIAKLFNERTLETYSVDIDIPEGCTVKRGEFSGDIIIRNQNKEIVRVVDFEAGYTVKLEYIYGEDKEK